FKAVMDGKQVAMLVPTTVLAQQHYHTFRARLAAFPTRVELLSRFRSEREQREVLEGLRSGAVDIVIGTHRLIQRDVQFKNLGLVIIDEEQRFGVVHKERLKQLRREVDVLTLSATPIPRTLHMAMVGVRDMSTLATAPEDRLPIRTFVAQYDEGLVRDAILREIERGGQVYFVHNRVRSIQVVAAQLQRLVPEAKIAIGHGQMPEDELERVMLAFSEGEYDVLVCTTIIESGLDLPNVNTIIVNQAHRFGLSQLYQLRGRVGRGANRAYAYFLYTKDGALTEAAEQRLRTIAEATELGAGFRIAMKDLEIRGAGNLLGAEQSGHISAVGFDLYCRLLAEAVESL
ncbi:MAG: DEAD/DEAH box helicase, partial [Dactylosporangium sp.]|nr:DEAD/DEAH box helicase [Dactylosporangium sp.]